MDENSVNRPLFGKPPVTALQEYCAKKGLPAPLYDWTAAENGAFVCRVETSKAEAYGDGRSKREAKHSAAANIIKILNATHPDLKEIPQAPHENIPNTDMIITLRDYCVQNDYPLPCVNIIQQAGPAEAPEFTAVCSLASLKTTNTANNKKEAKQKACLDMLNVIIDKTGLRNTDLQVATTESKFQNLESQRYFRFKTYREFQESQSSSSGDVPISQRHMYFTKFYDTLKNEALRILASDGRNPKTQIFEVLKALNITAKTKTRPCKKHTQKMVIISLDCLHDICFAGLEDQVYVEMLDYFRQMFRDELSALYRFYYLQHMFQH